MDTPEISQDEPCYSISVAARMVNLHPQTLRKYEDEGLVVPRRSPGNMRLYSPDDIERLHKITRLSADLGVNLAGVHIILNLTAQIEALHAEQERLRARLDALDAWR